MLVNCLIPIMLFCFFSYSNLAMEEEERPVRVLSLDGGGIRGIISAVALAKIEAEMGKPISEIFDLIAGTSVGGITALALTIPDENGEPKYSAQDIINTYYEKGGDVFYRSISHIICSLGVLRGPKYEASHLEGWLQHYFGDALLEEALTNVMVTGYSIEGQEGIEFASDDHFYKHFNMWELARATSAAPILFDSALVQFDEERAFHIVDGGLFANNPALHAYCRARILFPNRKIEIYSIGTGESTIEEVDTELSGRGLMSWIRPGLRHLLTGGSASDNDILYKLLNEDGEKDFFRINIQISRDHRKLDDVSKKNMAYLIKKGINLTEMPLFWDMIERLKS